MEDTKTPLLAMEAMSRFRDGDPDWQRHWANLFMWISMEAANSQQTTESSCIQRSDDLIEVFDTLAEFFQDSSRGAKHPLGEPKRPTGRPPSNRISRNRNMYVAAVAGLEIAKSAGSGVSQEDCFRKAAQRIGIAGGSVNWRQVRSAWNNRERHDLKVLDTLLNLAVTFEDLNEELLNGYARQAAKYTKSKAPIL